MKPCDFLQIISMQIILLYKIIIIKIIEGHILCKCCNANSDFVNDYSVRLILKIKF